LPGEKEREAILKILLRDEQLAEDVDVKTLAKKTEGFSGSDLKHLCVSAALDAVKEYVQLPWSVPGARQTDAVSETLQASTSSVVSAIETSLPDARILRLRNFLKALKEITPSSSESLGSLSELRKWNEEFGEGQKDKKRQVWGRGRFGFINKGLIDESGAPVDRARSSSHTSMDTTSIG